MLRRTVLLGTMVAVLSVMSTIGVAGAQDPLPTVEPSPTRTVVPTITPLGWVAPPTIPLPNTPTYTPTPVPPTSTSTATRVVPTQTATATPTATPLPTATPTVHNTARPQSGSGSSGQAQAPTAIPPEAESLADPANLRGGPGTEYAVAGTLAKGSRLPITGRAEGFDWWQVAAATDTGRAWVAKSVVTVHGDTSSVPLVPVPMLTVPAALPNAGLGSGILMVSIGLAFLVLAAGFARRRMTR